MTITITLDTKDFGPTGFEVVLGQDGEVLNVTSAAAQLPELVSVSLMVIDGKMPASIFSDSQTTSLTASKPPLGLTIHYQNINY